MMSRATLRRQRFHKNLDLLMQNSLETLEEESGYREDLQPVTDLDASMDLDGPMTIEIKGSKASFLTPIYRSLDKEADEERDLYQKRNRQETTSPCKAYKRQPTVYTEPWSPVGASPDTEPWSPEGASPDVPFTQADGLKKAEKPVGDTKGPVKKLKPVIAPLHIPNSARHSNRGNHDRSSLPFSPINPEPGSSARVPLWKSGSFKMSLDEDEVRALPMSPAHYMSQICSTPAPTNAMSTSPLCHSEAENSTFNHNYPECNMCRICHEDGSREKLVSPCHCMGTMGMLHMSCLEKWLGSSKTTKCEICQFQFIVLKKARSLRWYMKEPSLHSDRHAMVKDIVLTSVLGVLILLICIMCLIFAERLSNEKKHVPATILILVTTSVLILYSAWLWVAVRRIRNRLSVWHRDYHVITIKQKADPQDTSNRIFRRFPSRLSRKSKKSQKTKTNSQPTPGVDNSSMPGPLRTSTYISYSLESYKAAMFNPVTPAAPLLQDENNNDVTSLDEDSPSVMSLDIDDSETSILYYQPPEAGSTSILCSNKGRQLRETGV